MGYSTVNGVAADSQGNAYVTGETFAADYPQTAGLPAGKAHTDVGSVSAGFFAKISPAGDKILYGGGLTATSRACSCCSSCFLSTLSTAGTGIAVDPAGNAYVAGNTNGTGLPTTAGVLQTDGIGAFVAKVNAPGTALSYLTMLGKTNYPDGPYSNPGNTIYGIAADAAGKAYLAGSTSDPDFPATTSAFQPKLSIPASELYPFLGPPADAFAAKLNATGSAMVWATFLGGTGDDRARTVAVDPTGNIWLSGTTGSSDFPASSGFPGGGEFLAELNAGGSSLLSAARFPGDTVGTALTLDTNGVLHASGNTGLVSTFTPGQSSAPRLFGVANAAGGALAGRVAAGELISLYGLHFGVSVPGYGSFNGAGLLPTVLGGIGVTINDAAAPLLYVSDTQINAVAPDAVSYTGSAALRVTLKSTALPDFGVVVDTAIPEVFRRADGSVAAINQDGTPNTEAHPALGGAIVSIWATGVGTVPGLADGQMATAAQKNYCCIIRDVYNSQDITPSYAGAAPGMVNGIVQINFPATGSGNYALTSNGKSSEMFSIFVGQ
jgi:uncharacterized protein (TIGR03437 family)